MRGRVERNRVECTSCSGTKSSRNSLLVALLDTKDEEKNVSGEHV